MATAAQRNRKEVSHYVVTAFPPGAVLHTACCTNFTSEASTDIVLAKSRGLEIRTTPTAAAGGSVESQQLLPLLAEVPIHGRIASLHALPPSHGSGGRSLLLVTTKRWQYAVLGYQTNPKDEVDHLANKSGPYPLVTHASGSLSAATVAHPHGGPASPAGASSGNNNNDGPVVSEGSSLLGREAETGPLVAIHPRCIVLHVFDGFLTVLPVNPSYQAAARSKAAVWGTPPRPTTSSSFLGHPFHCRVEERTILALTFVPTQAMHAAASSLPQLAILYQDARGVQHLTTHMIHVGRQQLYLHGSSSVPPNSPPWWKKTAVDGGSALLLAVPPRVPATTTTTPVRHQASTVAGGVLLIGQRQITYCAPLAATKIIPVPQALYLAATELPADPESGLPRFLLADEFGNLHMLSLLTAGPAESPTNHIQGLQLETLGSCNLASCLAYLGQGLAFVGSAMGDSQLVQIHDEPFSEQGLLKKETSGESSNDEDDEDIMLLETTYLQVLEEFPNLGPILDFDLIPTTLGGASTSTSAAALSSGGAPMPKESGHQPVVPSQVVTASGSSKSGTIRLIRNGIGMKESASVDIPGISQMWSLRQSFSDAHDTYLVQSFVGETRVLGVVETTYEAEGDEDQMADEEPEVVGALEEVLLPCLDSSVPTLYMGNLETGDRWLQITPQEVRLLAATTPTDMATTTVLLDSWHVSTRADLLSQPIITVATGNEAGQVAIALTGGHVLYFCTTQDTINAVSEQKMDQEVSCLDLHPFHKLPADVSMTEEDGAMAAEESRMLAVGLWDDFTVRLLSLENQLEDLLKIRLQEETEEEADASAVATPASRNHRNQMMMARSLCFITLDFTGGSNSNNSASAAGLPGVDMLFVGLGDGTLISFAVVVRDGRVSVQAKKEVCLGTQRIELVPLSTTCGGSCVMATGDRPTVIYLAGVSGGASAEQVNPKLCYSNVNLSPSEDEGGPDGVHQQISEQTISVNVASPFFSPLLFDSESLGSQHYSLCVADDSCLRLGIIDDIQKLHVTTCRLGMAPRRIVHCPEGRLFAVGCIESGIKHVGLGGPETNSMGNCIRFMDDTTFEDLDRVDLEPYETILSMAYISLSVPKTQASPAETHRRFLMVGTAYVLPDEDEPSRGKILVYSCEADGSSAGSTNRQVRPVTELFTQGAVYSICQFYQGMALCSVNTKTMMAKLVDDTGVPRLQFLGVGHHGHMLSYCVRSMAEGNSPSQQSMGIDGTTEPATEDKEEMLAIVGDLMRSIGLVQYYPEHSTLEEVARDFSPNWTTAVEMLTEDVYLGSENWGNLFCLRRNKAATSEEVRYRLDSIGEFNLGEMCNKFMRGSLVMPVSSTNNGTSNRRALRRTASPQKGKDSANAPRLQRPVVVTGSQTLFGTADGTLGVVLGLDGRTAAFFACLEKAMSRVIRPVGDFSHELFRSCKTESRTHPAHGFVDGDLVETFVDLDRSLMEAVVKDMNRDGGWEVDDMALKSEENKAADEEDFSVELTVEDVLSMVEEISMLH